MNMNYTILLCFTMSSLLVQIGAVELTEEEKRVKFNEEEKAIELCYKLTIQKFGIPYGSVISTEQFYFILGERHAKKILQCIIELKEKPELTNREFFGEFLRGVCRKTQTDMLKHLNTYNKENDKMFCIGEKTKKD